MASDRSIVKFQVKLVPAVTIIHAAGSIRLVLGARRRNKKKKMAHGVPE